MTEAQKKIIEKFGTALIKMLLFEGIEVSFSLDKAITELMNKEFLEAMQEAEREGYNKAVAEYEHEINQHDF